MLSFADPLLSNCSLDQLRAPTYKLRCLEQGIRSKRQISSGRRYAVIYGSWNLSTKYLADYQRLLPPEAPMEIL